jgi:myo-inositol-1(or 4)-monophosphatase
LGIKRRSGTILTVAFLKPSSKGLPLLNPDLAFALESAKLAGDILLAHFGKSPAVWLKCHDHPVSHADVLVDSFLKQRFAGRYPEDAWLSEETCDDLERLSSRRVWIVDPLDGTKEFVEGIPEFSVSIALVEDESPGVAVVYNPARNDLYYAERNQGAHHNGNRVRMARPDPANSPCILVSRTEWSNHFFSAIQGFGVIQPMGSIAYKSALVAGLEAQLVVSVTPKSEWDICAGYLLIHEAGGRLTDLSGREIKFNQPIPKIEGVLAAHPVLHQKALAWFSGCFKNP